jgi:CubicO group peptidase (beta-lactamase class C family)
LPNVRPRPLLLALLAVLVAALMVAPAAGAAGCPSGRIKVATGCASRAAVAKRIEAIVRQSMPELGVRATLLRVDTGERTLFERAFGNSMKGVPATTRMHVRIGSMAIPYLITVLLQLQEEGKLSLDDKLAKYRPNFPEAGEVTLRQLADVSSGYPDWVQENEPFQDVLLENPFRQWTSNELLHWAFTQPVACAPGTCFHYAHTNFAILSQVISKVTGEPVSKLIRERVLAPLGLDSVQISRFPAMPGPVLHAYVAERGPYEDATFWSPSWSIGNGTVMSGTLADIVHTARAIGTGALISKRSSAERFASSGVPPFTKNLYYGLGILVNDGWEVQNPMIDGYTGIQAYLPQRDLSVGLVTTTYPKGARATGATATQMFGKLSAYLSPGHPFTFGAR